jgi:hypothetical protein
MASGIWPWRNGVDFAMTCPDADAAGTGEQTIAQEVKKRANSTEAA